MVVVIPTALKYAITDLTERGATSPRERRIRLREQIQRLAEDHVDFLQLREKQLEAGELLSLAQTAMDSIHDAADACGKACPMRLLINGRADVAAAAGAHGVHLTGRSDELRPERLREVFRSAGLSSCVVSATCHNAQEVVRAGRSGADVILFGPVFEKKIRGELVTEGLGLEALREACAAAGPIPVLALGGISVENAPLCLRAGAAGIAGIRLFSEQRQ